SVVRARPTPALYTLSLHDALPIYPADVGAGWGGEAFGTGAAAMTIEGNWIVGALRNDFPDTPYRVVELPAGPAGKGTLQFTNCRSEEHTSELQSRENLVCRLLLEK